MNGVDAEGTIVSLAVWFATKVDPEALGRGLDLADTAAVAPATA